MTVTAQYVRQTNCHAPPFAVPPSHEATMKSCGPDDHDPGRTAMIRGSAADLGGPRRTPEKAGAGAKWTYLSHACAVRVPSAASPCGTAEPLLVLPAEYSSSRCLSGLRLPTRVANPHREHQRNTDESTPAATDAALSHTSPFSIHGVAPVTRLILGTHLHNRHFSFYASSSAIMSVRSPTPTLASEKAQACTPMIFRSTAAHSPTAQPFHRPSTPSTPIALERRKRHAPRLPVLLAARTLQHDGSTCDLRHTLEGAISCANPYHVHALNTVPGRTHPSPSLAPPVAFTARFLAAHAAFIASSRTTTLVSSVPPSLLEARTCCAPQHLLPLQRTSTASRTLPIHARAPAHLRHDTDHPRRAQPMRQPLPSARTALITYPPSSAPYRPPMEAGSCPAPGVVCGAPRECSASVAGVLPPLTPASLPSRELYPSSIAPPCNRIPARASSALHLPLLSGTSTQRVMRRRAIGSLYASFEAGRLELASLSARLAGGEHWGRGAWCVERAGAGEGVRKRLVESGPRCVGSARTTPILVPSVGATSAAPPVSAPGASPMIFRPPYRPVLLHVVVVEALRVQ
ncbi:hypothetical protein DFH08DRAFT_957913 [Mycena albidolilacea]|uniref:Uncharacterized protein n=1 Tax=Mycena albidolilacea TaxID=1033008 RepID=A0AAD7A808_9AGAR|nr:hypothetical protein DFH08DRAFT_957913 [Mycena albidolilacea]